MSNTARMTPESSVNKHDALSKKATNGNGVILGNKKYSLDMDKEFNASLLDETNRKAISLLEENVFLSQTEIAKELGLSQSSIALRLDKLRKSGILTETAGVHLKMIGLEMCRVDANCSDPRSILEWAMACPLFINGSVGVGGTNVSLYFASEDIEMFQAIVDGHVRKLEGVSGVDFFPIVTWGRDYVASLKLDVSKSENPPCNKMPYCPKCPANPDYKGKIFNRQKRR